VFSKRPRLLGLAVAVTILVPLLLWGQTPVWLPSGNNLYVPAGTSVGVGTTPAAGVQLFVAGPGQAFNATANGGSGTVNYGVLGQAVGAATANTGFYANAFGAASNYGVRIVNPAAGANNWAIYSDATAQSYFAGNVGIGTTSPEAHLDVSTYDNANSIFRVFNTVNNGSGSSASTAFIHSDQAAFAGTATGNWTGTVLRVSSYPSTSSRNQGFVFQAGTSGGHEESWVPYLSVVASTGNVGIGTTSPQYPLSVNGTIQAKQVLVNTGWSDYVFARNYRLKPLSEVASYIKTNGHLPDIPSAKEVEAKGVNLGDMQSKLLAKVEELTLHMIEEHDRNDRLERQNRELQERIARLETGRRTAGSR